MAQMKNREIVFEESKRQTKRRDRGKNMIRHLPLMKKKY